MTEKHPILPYTILIIAGFFIIYFFYKLITPPKVSDFKKISVTNSPIKAGEEVNLKVDYCKYLDYDSEISISFVNDSINPSYTVLTDLPLGCANKVFILTLPLSTKPGKYIAGMKITYNTNPPFKGAQYVLFSQPFDVIQ